MQSMPFPALFLALFIPTLCTFVNIQCLAKVLVNRIEKMVKDYGKLKQHQRNGAMVKMFEYYRVILYAIVCYVMLKYAK